MQSSGRHFINNRILVRVNYSHDNKTDSKKGSQSENNICDRKLIDLY